MSKEMELIEMINAQIKTLYLAIENTNRRLDLISDMFESIARDLMRANK